MVFKRVPETNVGMEFQYSVFEDEKAGQLPRDMALCCSDRSAASENEGFSA
jgi:hypothetical protein